MNSRQRQPFSKWQLLNMRSAAGVTILMEQPIDPGSDARKKLHTFENCSTVTVRHDGPLFVEVSVYNAQNYQMPQLRIKSVQHGYDETDPDDPFYYVTITFHQLESGTIRITY